MTDKNLSLIERAVGRMTERSEQTINHDEPRSTAERSTNPGSESRSDVRTETHHRSSDSSSRDRAADGIRSERPVATIDLQRLKAEGYVTPMDGRSRVAEEFRMIKRPLLINAFGKGETFGQGEALVPDGNMVMVTSTYPGEGKTFTAINLAMSITKEMDKTVLLIDADVGRSRIHRILGTPAGPGLIDLLLDENIDLGDVIVRTDIPNLRVLPMGRSHAHATELLASNEMGRITHELATRYPDRIVIFDSPPLLITSEAVVLSSHMGQIVFVVESGRTPQGAVKAALALLDDNKPIGLVLNKTRQALGAGYYGYSYSYGSYHHAEGAAA